MIQTLRAKYSASCICCEDNIPKGSSVFGIKKTNESWLFLCSRKCVSSYQNEDDSEAEEVVDCAMSKSNKTEFQVEKISDFKGDSCGSKSNWLFLVHWVGFSKPSWEHWDNIKDTVAVRVFLRNNNQSEMMCASDSDDSDDEDPHTPIGFRDQRRLAKEKAEKEFEEGYLVEQILDFKGNPSGPKSKWKVFVKWVGYSEDENTWEPFEEFVGNPKLSRFLRINGLTELSCFTTKKEESTVEVGFKNRLCLQEEEKEEYTAHGNVIDLTKCTRLEDYNTVCEEMSDFIVPDGQEENALFIDCDGPILPHVLLKKPLHYEGIYLEKENSPEADDNSIVNNRDLQKRKRVVLDYDESLVEAVIKELEKRYVLVPREQKKVKQSTLFCSTCDDLLSIDSFSAAQQRDKVKNNERVCLKHSSSSAFNATFNSVCCEASGFRLK